MLRPILIIEDDPNIAEILRYSLAAQHFETRVAGTGSEGLAACRDKQNPPQLILLDSLLPEINGLDICRLLRKEPSTAGVPIIMVTAKSSLADVESARAAGVNDYLMKPFSIRTLMESIGALLNSRETERTPKIL